jgi:lysyl-tRNA synthetase class 2
MRGKQDHSRERALRHDQTDAERHLWQALRNRRLGGFRFRRQHRIGPYYADFACTEASLVVELDGSQHLQQHEHDALRTACLQQRGYRVLRFWNDDARLRTDEVLDAILGALRTPHPASLREAVPLPAPRGEGKQAMQGRAVLRPAPRGEGKQAMQGRAVLRPAPRGEGKQAMQGRAVLRPAPRGEGNAPRK